MKHFIVQDNKKTVGKVLNGIELANRKNNKLCQCVDAQRSLAKKKKKKKTL